MRNKNFKPVHVHSDTHKKLKHKSADTGLSLAQMVDLMADMDNDALEELRHRRKRRGF